MNKTKKIATAAISIVMAGTMAGSLAACTPKKPSTPSKPEAVIKTLEYTSGTTVRTAIGYNSATTAASFDTTTLPLVNADGSQAATSIKLPDGKTYNKGSLKPLWQSYQSALNIAVEDKWPVGTSTLTTCAENGLDGYDLIGAGSVAEIVIQQNAGQLLNLADYMDYLPNLRQFLENNALAELGTLADVDSGAVYYSPYYAGMNDAERYNLFRKDYVSELLDYADLSQAASKNGGTISFKAQADAKQEKHLGNRGQNETYNGSKSSIESYMGKTGSYIVKTTKPGGGPTETVFVKVNYDAAKTAATTEGSALYNAIKNATKTEENTAGTAYSGTSGNIVDLQNFAINQTQGGVKGEHLLNILREYIKVAYEYAETENASTWGKFYDGATFGTGANAVTTKLSDIINASWAAWDVDIYAAIGRVFVTCGNFLGSYQAQTSAHTNNGASTWLLVFRTGDLNRTTRQAVMIGELYGVRGMEGQTYLDSSGTLRNARYNVATWDAMHKFSAFHTEGLVPSYDATTSGNVGIIGTNGASSLYDGTDTHYQGLSYNDFIHTQATLKTNQYASDTYVETTDGYTFTGVATPVSKWLTNDTSKVSATGEITPDFNGKLDARPNNKCTIMRFTESALKLKGGGLVIPKATANNPDRLNATLALLDYIYSNDGQIVTTFGDISTTDNLTGNATDGYQTTNNGWWYGEKVTSLKNPDNGSTIDITNKTMEDLKKAGIVTTVSGKVQEDAEPTTGKTVYDATKHYVMTEAYQSQALVYKNELYRTGTNSATNGGHAAYDNGYTYKGVMTPYFTNAIRMLCNGDVVNGYKQNSGKVWSSTDIQNNVLGMESHGIVNNAGMVQLCNDMAVEGFDVISTIFGNGSGFTVSQGIDKNNPWFTCAPTVTLPTASQDIVDGYSDFTELFQTKDGKQIRYNYFYLETAWYGASASLNNWNLSGTTGDITTPEGIVAYMKNIASQYEMLNNAAWSELYTYYINK